MNRGWIGVALDGTLAFYDHWQGASHIGPPVPFMVDRVKLWRREGKDVRIFTARVAFLLEHLSPEPEQTAEAVEALAAIKAWCREHLGEELKVTSVKDFHMIELWDDRCVQVITNTGLRADGVLITLGADGHVAG